MIQFKQYHNIFGDYIKEVSREDSAKIWLYLIAGDEGGESH